MDAAADELTRLQTQLEAAASLPLDQLAAMPCLDGGPHRWAGKSGKPKKCKGCHLTDFRAPEPVVFVPRVPEKPYKQQKDWVPPRARRKPQEKPFDRAGHREAVRHAVQAGQSFGPTPDAPRPLPTRPKVG